MQVQLTHEDINKSVSSDYGSICLTCPIARALIRTFPKAQGVLVGAEKAMIDGREFLLSENVRFVTAAPRKKWNLICPIIFVIEGDEKLLQSLLPSEPDPLLVNEGENIDR